MKTTFDFASLIVFGLLAAVYLHRCAQEARDAVPLWAYATVALGCAGGDVLANHSYVPLGALCLVVALLSTVWIARTGEPVQKR